MTVRVVVNLLWLAPGRVGGSEEYLVRQLHGLLDVEPRLAEQLTLAVEPRFAEAHPGLAGRCNLVVPPGRLANRGARVAAEHSWLMSQTRAADLVHHGGGTAPLVGPGPRVVTVHDLQFRHFPHYFSRGRRSYLAAMMPQSVRRASIVATPTDFVRSTVIEAYDVEPDRVHVVPHGVPASPRPSDAAITAARSHVGLGPDDTFVVYPAITHPHKGHRVLVDMLDHLDRDMRLVLIGGAGSAEPQLRAAIARSVHRDRIVRTGRVDPDVRDALVAEAAAVVVPSEFEGFGAPAVEAMAAGTPLVISDAEALREVAGRAAVLVDDPSGAAWAHAVEQAIGRRSELVELGAERSVEFSLARSGSALLSAYRAAVAT